MPWDPSWEALFQTRGWGKYPSESLIRFIASNFYSSERSNIRILELGCGPGANLWFCAREGFQVFGIDGSNSAIELCRDRLDTEVPGWTGDLLVGDVLNSSFIENNFDCIIDNQCLSCLDLKSASSAISQAYKLLRPDGLLYSRTFARGSYGDGTGKQIDPFTYVCSEGPTKDLGPCRFSTPDLISSLFCDLKLLSLDTLDWTHSNRSHQIKELIAIFRKPHF